MPKIGWGMYTERPRKASGLDKSRDQSRLRPAAAGRLSTHRDIACCGVGQLRRDGGAAFRGYKERDMDAITALVNSGQAVLWIAGIGFAIHLVK